MHVAIVHDWLNGMRGGEKVLEVLLELFPSAEIFTLFHEKGKVSARIESHGITTSWLNRVPGIYKRYRDLLPLFPMAIRSLDLRGFDLVVSSSHAVAQGAQCTAALHACYCHTPMRYAWDAAEDYRSAGLRRAALSAIRPALQRWDRAASCRVDHFIANSHFVRDRIYRYYGRNAEVIPPPVDTRFFSPCPDMTRGDYYLGAGALVPYKRFDIVIDAFNRLGRRLVIAGSGPELGRLRRMARSNIEFTGWVDDDTLRRFYRSAKALVFAGREDFGMVPVEAQSCGCPVIAFAGGGVLETVVHGTTGVLFEQQTSIALMRGVETFEQSAWPIERVRSHAGRFSREIFKARFQETISNCLAERDSIRAGLGTFALQAK